MAKASNVLSSLVVVLLIAGAGYYLFVMDDGIHSPLRETVELNIRIESPGIASNTEFILCIDGEEIETGTIAKDSHVDLKFTCERTKGKKILVEVRAVSTIPVLGDRAWSDSETVTVGVSSYNITLNYLPIW